MNSLNILSARVSPPQTPTPSRSNSYTNFRGSRGSISNDSQLESPTEIAAETDEKTPLVSQSVDHPHVSTSGWHIVPERFLNAIISSIRWVLSTIAAPGVYLFAYLYDQDGVFAPLSPFHRLGELLWGPRRTNTRRQVTPPVFSDSESDRERSVSPAEGNESEDSVGRRPSHASETDEIAPARRSIRIKLHHDESLRKRKRKSQAAAQQTTSTTEISPALLKSPTAGATSSLLLTKYPRAPAPPRPLIPRRLPSYSAGEPGSGRPQKTLILDLDETLIHSMAKGGRMSSGHMVEVKLNTYIGPAGSVAVGPQHPILYYVHKRPHCDDFLRRVCKWYNLVIFTASVQEYADPVIDWLEQERKFFSGRYYRQHCTYRHGAFIKDLSSVEPDLSKVMILDNSPLSYMFHQDNAIPIEGWISDPTDNDLLHLVPLLEGLQYVTDVRALLALRGGEDGKHMVA